MNEQRAAGHRCGFAAIVGRPNVGKSTLLNALLGRKISIVSPKPQTTRHRILGILTRPEAQVIFVDTPGLHAGARRAMNRHMNRAALASLQDADVNVFVVEALRWTDEDQRVLDELVKQDRPIVLVLNKVDKVFPKERLLPFIEELGRARRFAEIVPLSALKRSNIEQLPAIDRRLPAGVAAAFPRRPANRPLAAVPGRGDRAREADAGAAPGAALRRHRRRGAIQGGGGRLLINAVIWVERSGQKAIVIGNGGEQLKEVGRAARLEMNELFGRRRAPGAVGEGEGELGGQRALALRQLGLTMT